MKLVFGLYIEYTTTFLSYCKSDYVGGNLITRRYRLQRAVDFDWSVFKFSTRMHGVFL